MTLPFQVDYTTSMVVVSIVLLVLCAIAEERKGQTNVLKTSGQRWA